MTISTTCLTSGIGPNGWKQILREGTHQRSMDHAVCAAL